MLLAAVICWWLVLPTPAWPETNVAAVNSGDFGKANAMCSVPGSQFPGFFSSLTKCHATIAPLTWHNVLNGSRDITTDFGSGYRDHCKSVRN